MTKKICILGSTGSIGTQTLNVIDNIGDITVSAIAANKNTKVLEQQVRKYRPDICVVYDDLAYNDMKARVSDTDTKVLSGMEGLLCAVETDCDTVMAAMVGSIGLEPTLSAIKNGKTIALANKETLVTAGHIVMREAKRNNVKILPVDSEHSAIFQCLGGEKKYKRIILTASGGPFYGKMRSELDAVRASDALRHPNWDMGGKITIDSATLMNKGLEVIEAKWLFGAELSQIEVVVQRESIIHSMVEFEDNAILAQLGTPDMAVPIQLALTYPERKPSPAKALDFNTISSISFGKPDMEAFPCLKLALKSAEIGGSLPSVMNAANEEAVYKFLKDEIKFNDIPRICQEVMDAHSVIADPDLFQVLSADKWARDYVKEVI